MNEFTVRQDIVDAIIAHARSDAPEMACGLVAGPYGSDRPERCVPIENAEHSPTFWRFDELAHLRAWREMDQRDEQPVIIYYSDATGEAYPSESTAALADEPEMHYLIVSLRHDRPVLRSFRIVNHEVIEEALNVVPSYEAPTSPAPPATTPGRYRK